VVLFIRVACTPEWVVILRGIHMRKSQNAFTIIELLIVVILLGIIAVFGIPNYDKSRAAIAEKDGAKNLGVIATAMEVYRVRNEGYPTVGLPNVAAINRDLNLGVIEQNIVYSCASVLFAYTCTANPDDYAWSLTISQTDAGIPVCVGGPCPSL